MQNASKFKAPSKELHPQRASPCLCHYVLTCSRWRGWRGGGRTAAMRRYLILFTSLFNQRFMFGVSCLAELVVVSNCSLCINRHVRGDQPRSGRRYQIKSHLCLVYSQLVALHALGQVWLPENVLRSNVGNSPCASIDQPPSPRMLLRTLTCAPRMQYTKASTYWFKRESPACVSPFTLSGTNQSNCLSATCPLMMNPSMFPLSFPVSLSSGKRWIEGFDNVTDRNIHFLNGQELPSS